MKTVEDKTVVFMSLVISGLQIHDTCGSPELAQEHLYQIISSVQNQRNVTSQPKLIGELEISFSRCFHKAPVMFPAGLVTR